MKNNPQRYFKNISTLALTVLIILLGFSVFGFQKMRQTEKTSGWVKQTINSIAKIHELESSILQLGNDQRDFIITGQHQFREQFFKTVPMIDENYRELETLIHNIKEQLTISKDLQQLIEYKKKIKKPWIFCKKAPKHFQLILLDGRMPKMDGFTLAEKIQTHCPHH